MELRTNSTVRPSKTCLNCLLTRRLLHAGSVAAVKATRFRSALITSDGLVTTWADVPPPAEQSELLLSVLARRTDGSTVQFGTKWVRDAADFPIVFAWDSAAVQQKNHENASSAITREEGAVRVLFPRSWVDALLDADELPAEAVVTVDGIDESAVELDLEKD